MYTNEFPIIACSTGLDSNTAIGIIRISGFENISIFDNFLTLNSKNIVNRTAHHCNLINGKEHKVIDDIIIIYYENPNSFTGENLLEIHCHGNLLNINRIIDLFISDNICVLAKPGEFSYRAFKNKKLNLSQIEGLDNFLNASSSLMLDEGISLLNGKLKSEYLELHNLFLNFRSSIDLLTDFAEDIGDQQAMENLKQKFSKFKRLVNSLAYRSNLNTEHLSQAKVTIFGQTNAGKSSLFNKFLGKNRAIISPLAGTTRDYISEYIKLDDIFFELVDTAGIRKTSDEIEEIGIQKASELIDESFYKILVINPNLPFNLYNNEKFNTEYDLLVVTHIDCLKCIVDLKKLKYKKILFTSLAPIEPILKSGPIGADLIKDLIGSIGPDKLVYNFSDIQNIITDKYKQISNKSPIINKRHRININNINKLCVEFSESLVQDDIGIMSFYSQKFSFEITELIGFIDCEQSLNNIFDNFCIGK